MKARCSPGDLSILVAFIVCSLVVGCSEPPAGQPQEAAPGETIVVQKENAGFKNPDDIGVTIGGKPAPVVRVVDESTVEVMIPKLSPGPAEVRLVHKGKTLGTFKTTVNPAPLRRLSMTLDGDEFRVDRVRPYTGHYDRPAVRGRRLSYDVVDENGRLIYTGAIRFPADETVEVFGYPGSTNVRREKIRGPVRFNIKIPYVEGTARVRLYRVEDGVDLSNPRGRATRRFIREFEVNP